MRATWYILEDGTNADPREVALGKDGVLRNKKGVAVAIGSHGNPRTTGVDIAEPTKTEELAERGATQKKGKKP